MWSGSVTMMSTVISATQGYQAWWVVTARWNEQCAGAPIFANERPFIHPVPGSCAPVRPWEIWKDVTE
jgi:hypothetical protein